MTVEVAFEVAFGPPTVDATVVLKASARLPLTSFCTSATGRLLITSTPKNISRSTKGGLPPFTRRCALVRGSSSRRREPPQRDMSVTLTSPGMTPNLTAIDTAVRNTRLSVSEYAASDDPL